MSSAILFVAVCIIYFFFKLIYISAHITNNCKRENYCLSNQLARARVNKTDMPIDTLEDIKLALETISHDVKIVRLQLHELVQKTSAYTFDEQMLQLCVNAQAVAKRLDLAIMSLLSQSANAINAKHDAKCLSIKKRQVPLRP